MKEGLQATTDPHETQGSIGNSRCSLPNENHTTTLRVFVQNSFFWSVGIPVYWVRLDNPAGLESLLFESFETTMLVSYGSTPSPFKHEYHKYTTDAKSHRNLLLPRLWIWVDKTNCVQFATQTYVTDITNMTWWVGLQRFRGLALSDLGCKNVSPTDDLIVTKLDNDGGSPRWGES